MMSVLYFCFVGLPMSLLLMMMGVLACVTIIGIPLGLVCFAAGFKVLSPPRSNRVVLKVERARAPLLSGKSPIDGYVLPARRKKG